MRFDEVVGYTYDVGLYCPDDVIGLMIQKGKAPAAAEDRNSEYVLDELATGLEVTREDENSFDSEDFPKVILAIDSEGLACGTCNKALKSGAVVIDLTGENTEAEQQPQRSDRRQLSER